MPVLQLREQGFEVTAFFFNPNIHPLEEYELRREALHTAAQKLNFPVLWEPEYGTPEAVDPQAWVQGLGENVQEGPRCFSCYSTRLEAAAQVAAERGFDSFSSSLLYSRYQQHEVIREKGEAAAQRAGTQFLYRDFRPWWQQGIDLSKELGLYRQKWCGCILSKGEAEAQRAQRAAAKAAKAAARAAREAATP